MDESLSLSLLRLLRSLPSDTVPHLSFSPPPSPPLSLLLLGSPYMHPVVNEVSEGVVACAHAPLGLRIIAREFRPKTRFA